jgi:hypothetical protein
MLSGHVTSYMGFLARNFTSISTNLLFNFAGQPNLAVPFRKPMGGGHPGRIQFQEADCGARVCGALPLASDVSRPALGSGRFLSTRATLSSLKAGWFFHPFFCVLLLSWDVIDVLVKVDSSSAMAFLCCSQPLVSPSKTSALFLT